MSRKTRAFTLVELLVVIGIIAVLISALLPALTKARQSANLLDCQARLRQMGQALQIYTVVNKGLVPWGVIPMPAPNPSNQEGFWWWHFALSEVMNKNILGPDGFVTRESPIFRDRDTIEGNDARYVNHYTCNPRILYGGNDSEYAPNVYTSGVEPVIAATARKQRKISSIKPSNAFVIWDAPQAMDYGYNAYELAVEMDGNGITYGHCFCLGSPNPIVKYDRAVTPGWQGQNIDGRALQKKYNRDLRQAFASPDGWLSHLRFRHMGNTSLAALCLDGHVEVRKVGTVMVKDICTNYY